MHKNAFLSFRAKRAKSFPSLSFGRGQKLLASKAVVRFAQERREKKWAESTPISHSLIWNCARSIRFALVNSPYKQPFPSRSLYKNGCRLEKPFIGRQLAYSRLPLLLCSPYQRLSVCVWGGGEAKRATHITIYANAHFRRSLFRERERERRPI